MDDHNDEDTLGRITQFFSVKFLNEVYKINVKTSLFSTDLCYVFRRFSGNSPFRCNAPLGAICHIFKMAFGRLF